MSSNFLTHAEGQAAIAKAMTERELQVFVRKAATALGWVIFATWNSRHSPAGEPDLRLVHPGQRRVIWAELKVQDLKKGALSPAQRMAIELLRQAGEEVYVWRPADWLDGTIERILGKP